MDAAPPLYITTTALQSTRASKGLIINRPECKHAAPRSATHVGGDAAAAAPIGSTKSGTEADIVVMNPIYPMHTDPLSLGDARQSVQANDGIPLSAEHPERHLVQQRVFEAAEPRGPSSLKDRMQRMGRMAAAVKTPFTHSSVRAHGHGEATSAFADVMLSSEVQLLKRVKGAEHEPNTKLLMLHAGLFVARAEPHQTFETPMSSNARAYFRT